MQKSLGAYKKSYIVEMNRITITLQQENSIEDLLFGRRDMQEMQDNFKTLKQERVAILQVEDIA